MGVENFTAAISAQDWSLHRQGPIDEARHNEKVKESIKDNLQNIISDGSIITADPKSKRIIKIPMRSLELPDIRYKSAGTGIGTGKGGTKQGDIIDHETVGTDGNGAGDKPGVEYYETQFTVDEIAQLVFSDLGLPYLQPKKRQTIDSEIASFNDVRKKRTVNNLDLTRTVLANMERNAREAGKAEIGNVSPEDYRVRTWNVETKQENNAVWIAIADISGSMGEFEKYMTRAFCWWSVNFLRSKYPSVDTVFVVHDTQAQEVDEEKFFKRGTGGGTKCSSGNELTMDLIRKRYSPQDYNVYVSHFTDGDNMSNDNPDCVLQVEQMLKMDISQYAYVQIGPKDTGGLFSTYTDSIDHERFKALKLIEKTDILPALRKVFDPKKQVLK